MNTNSIYNILSILNSTKLREKKDALDELTSLLKQDPSLIENKILQSVAEILIELLDLEQRKYCNLLKSFKEGNYEISNKLRLCEDRISFEAYVIRLFIEKTCNRFKQKTLNFLLIALPELIINNDTGELLAEIATHLTISINDLVRSEPFIFKFIESKWIEIMDKLTHFLQKQIDSEHLNDRVTTNILETVCSLLALDTSGIQHISNLSDVIIKLLRLSINHDTNTKAILRIANTLIITRHSIDLAKTLQLIRELLRYLIVFNESKDKTIQNELTLFDYCASELISTGIPQMDSIMQVANIPSQESIIPLLKEYMTLRLSRFKPQLFSTNVIQFNTLGYVKNNDFDGKYIYVSDENHFFEWIRLQSLVKLLLTYFSNINEDRSYLFSNKRTRIVDDISPILRTCTDLSQFILNCIDFNYSPTIFTLGCQLLFCFAIHYEINFLNGNKFKDKLIHILEGDQYNIWVLYALIPLISNKNTEFLEDDITKIFKISLSLVKSDDFGKVACLLIVHLIQYLPHIISEQKLVNDIIDMYEYSEINGPNFLSTESFEFWICLHTYGSNIAMSTELDIMTRLVKWLDSKWPDYSGTPCSNEMLSIFIAWLSGQSIDQYFSSYTVRTNSKLQQGYLYYSLKRWDDQRNTTNFLTLSKLRNFCPRKSKCTTTIGSIERKQPIMQQFLDNILNYVKSQCSKFDEKLIDSGITLLLIFDKLYNISLDSGFHTKCQETLDYIFKSKLLMTQKGLNALFLNFSLYQFHNIAGFLGKIFDFRIYKFALKSHKTIEENNLEDAYKDDLMFNTSFTGVVKGEIVLVRPDIIINVALNIFDWGVDEDQFSSLLEYVATLSYTDMYTCLDSVLQWLDCFCEKRVLPYKRFVVQFTEFLGERLLNIKYNTCSKTFEILSQYLNILQKYWRYNGMKIIDSDCCDILEWILSRVEDSSFSGEEALLQTAFLFLNILKHNYTVINVIEGGKKRIFASLMVILERLSVSIRYFIIQKISSYMMTISPKNQVILLSELERLYSNSSFEISVFYIQMLKTVTSGSYPLSVYFLIKILQNYATHIIKLYSLNALDSLAVELKLGNRKEMFCYFKWDILYYLCEQLAYHNVSIEQLEVSLFDFHDKSTFIWKFRKEIYAILYSMGVKIDILGSLPYDQDIKNEKALFKFSYPLIVPLTLVDNEKNENFINDKLLRHKYPLLDREYNIVIIKFLLRLIDFGDIRIIKETFICVFPNVKYIENVFDDLQSYRSYNFPLCISPKKGFALFNNYKINNWSQYRLIILWIFQDIQKARTDIEIIKAARETKFLILFAINYDSPLNVLQYVIVLFTQFLSNDIVLHEFCSIISLFFKFLGNYKSFPFDAFVNIMLLLLIRKCKYGKVNERLLKDLSNINMQKYPCAEIWKGCIELLNNRELTVNILKFIKPLLDEKYSKEIVCLISVLLGFINLQKVSETSSLSLNIIRKLLDTQIPENYITPQYKLWLSYIIKCYHHLDIMKHDTKANVHTKLLEVSTFPNYVNNLIRTFFEYYETKVVPTYSVDSFFYLTMINYFITLSLENPNIDLLTQDQIDQYSSTAFHINKNEFEFIMEQGIELKVLQEVLNEMYFESDLSYSDWICGLISSFINELQIDYPYLKAFNIIANKSILFSENIFIELVGLMTSLNPKDSTKWISFMLNDLGRLVGSSEGTKKVRLLTKLILLLRYGHYNGNRHFSRLYQKLDLSSICNSLVDIGEYNISLLLFEETHMGNSESNCFDLLQKIYKKLDDNDFMRGLPLATTLSANLLRINNWEQCSAKAFMFNNAKLDAEYNSNNMSIMLQSAKINNYGIISKLLSNKLKVNSDLYRWEMQLTEWKLPIPEKILDKSSGLYSVIKRISGKQSNIQMVLSDCIEKTFDNFTYFKTKNEWVSLLRELVLYKKIAFSIQGKDNERLPSLSEYRKNYLAQYSSDFGSQLVNLDAKYAFLKVLCNHQDIKDKLNINDANIYMAITLIEHIKLALLNRSTHYALRNCFTLENVMDQLKVSTPDPIIRNIESTYYYVTSITLWDCGEKKAAVNMLQTFFEKNSTDITNRSTVDNDDISIFSSSDEIRTKLILWLSELRLEPSSFIFDTYIKEQQNVSTNTTYLMVIAKFLKQQVHKIVKTGEIENLLKRKRMDMREASALQNIYENTKLSKNDRTEAHRQLARVNLQINHDSENLNNLLKKKNMYLFCSLDNFIKLLTLTNNYDDDVIDELCELWFENDSNEDLNNRISSNMSLVPSWKFLPWINQMVSKLSYNDSSFQRLLTEILTRLVSEVPFESIYALVNILMYEDGSTHDDKKLNQKVVAVKQIFSKVKQSSNSEFYQRHVEFTLLFSTQAIELAMEKYDIKTKILDLEALKIGQYWLNELPTQRLPLPTLSVNIYGSRNPELERPYITKVVNKVAISSSGLSLPKIVTFIISDGTRHKVLFKSSNDDLRQDAIMEQVFRQVNNILEKERSLINNNLNIRTYQVVPLGPRGGIIEFVANSMSLHQILTDLHGKDSISFSQARRIMKSTQNKSNEERLKAYRNITKEVKPQLHNFFFKLFLDPDNWYKAKKQYIKSVATASIAGYILGLGDRHLNNILIDSFTGEVIHIDLGIAFDQGRLLTIPELVPFRLTRDIVSGFGITGVNGLFRSNCEKVYSVLRANSDKVMCVLNILKWDPLYSWVMSPVKRHQNILAMDEIDISLVGDPLLDSNLQPVSKYETIRTSNDNKHKQIKESSDNQNKEAQRALSSVEEKLNAHGLSVEATVQDLIQEATNELNLAVIFFGWSPFY